MLLLGGGKPTPLRLRRHSAVCGGPGVVLKSRESGVVQLAGAEFFMIPAKVQEEGSQAFLLQTEMLRLTYVPFTSHSGPWLRAKLSPSFLSSSSPLFLLSFAVTPPFPVWGLSLSWPVALSSHVEWPPLCPPHQLAAPTPCAYSGDGADANSWGSFSMGPNPPFLAHLYRVTEPGHLD